MSEDMLDLMEEEEVEAFLSTISSDDGSVVPDDKIESRKWVVAYLKIKKEIDFLKKEYKPFLKGKYLDPIDDKVCSLEEQQDMIKEGLFEFLEEAEEQKVSFPDVGTAYKMKTKPKLLYPDDEKALIDKLNNENSEFISNKPILDKKKLLAEFIATGKVPIADLTGVGEGETVGIRAATKKKDK